MSNRRTSITGGNQKAPSRSPCGNRSVLHLSLQRKCFCLLTPKSHISVQGYLRASDALTLYEQAYFATGDVLELGSAWGLSTSIIARAIRNSGRPRKVVSVEIEPAFQLATKRTIRDAGLLRFYQALPGDAEVQVANLIDRHRQFGLVFVDHDHTYEASSRICNQLPAILEIGGYALFHDFNDERNRTEASAYGVYPAVVELISSASFAFAGVIGCCALVRRMSL